MQSLPAPTALFISKKTKILDALSVPDSDYTDLSPKGSVDEGIRHLIDEINVIDGLVTTSSCAGRVSVFLEGRKALEAGQEDGEIATPGGKGGGGNWLFVSHEPVLGNGWVDELELSEEGVADETPSSRRLIHFKFEPMVNIVVCCLVQTNANRLIDLACFNNVAITCAVHPTVCFDSRLSRIRRRQLGHRNAHGRHPFYGPWLRIPHRLPEW